ncbi:YciI family protein [Actinopolymorpha sp. B17G11]|uniref:YciI family protein n=1 Tax=unclassified Actinopolymorpha TaxID=2627063 RepID=UPI0032D8C3DA
MKYIMLAYTNPEGWANATPEEVQKACDFYAQLGKELSESGEFVATEGLGDPSHTVTVRKQDSGPVATDGPYAEVKEVLVSFGIVDVESHDRALEIAARIVDAIGDTVELRPLMAPDGFEA